MRSSTSAGLKYFGLIRTTHFPVEESTAVSSIPEPFHIKLIPAFKNAVVTNSRTVLVSFVAIT